VNGSFFARGGDDAENHSIEDYSPHPNGLRPGCGHGIVPGAAARRILLSPPDGKGPTMRLPLKGDDRLRFSKTVLKVNVILKKRTAAQK
jgi:hypothetical protein